MFSWKIILPVKTYDISFDYSVGIMHCLHIESIDCQKSSWSSSGLSLSPQGLSPRSTKLNLASNDEMNEWMNESTIIYLSFQKRREHLHHHHHIEVELIKFLSCCSSLLYIVLSSLCNFVVAYFLDKASACWVWVFCMWNVDSHFKNFKSCALINWLKWNEAAYKLSSTISLISNSRISSERLNFVCFCSLFEVACVNYNSLFSVDL